MQDQENNQVNYETKSDTSNNKPKSKVDLFPGVHSRQSSFNNNTGVRSNAKISIFNPLTFDEALDIVECLRERGGNYNLSGKYEKV